MPGEPVERRETLQAVDHGGHGMALVVAPCSCVAPACGSTKATVGKLADVGSFHTGFTAEFDSFVEGLSGKRFLHT